MKNPSAIVAADLHHVGATAESVSLAAKNAGLIAARASERGRAFEPIASYIDAITSSTQKGTAEVEALALELARAATRYLRALYAQRRYQRVFDGPRPAHFVASALEQ